MAVRVVLVDDVRESRHLVRTALRFRGGFDVVAEAADGESAVALAAEHSPDVVVLDLGLPDLAGHEVLARLRQRAPGAKVVIFTGRDPSDAEDLRAEVEGFVRKDADLDYLVDLLEHLTRSGDRRASIGLDRDLADVRTARRFVEQRLADWGYGDVIDDAVLITSELVTNAVTHAQSGCELRLVLGDGAVRIDVVDNGNGMPDPLVATPGDEHGRGLLLVSVLSKAWGVEVLDAGQKVVWAEVAVPVSRRGDAVPAT
jgi:CheY-like chemotaxis protein/anti-sigma regulatory factor (Ser/Thr protein kinase)